MVDSVLVVAEATDPDIGPFGITLLGFAFCRDCLYNLSDLVTP